MNKYYPIRIPRAGAIMEINGENFEVIDVNKYRYEDQYVAEFLIENKEINLSIKIKSKNPFKTDN